jgi:Putative zinc-finger
MRTLGVRRELVCQQVVELISDYIEGNLSRRLRAHLDGCEHCSEYLVQMRATIRLTGRLRVEDLSPAMSEEFETIYRRWRAEEG